MAEQRVAVTSVFRSKRQLLNKLFQRSLSASYFHSRRESSAYP